MSTKVWGVRPNLELFMSDFTPMFLIQVHPGMFYLDHRLRPEVRAMFCAMSSRMPAGGIEARYFEVIEAVAKDEWNTWRDNKIESVRPDIVERLAEMGRTPEQQLHTWENIPPEQQKTKLALAELRLCEMPLHPKVQEFFDRFVLAYGHSSILELTGSPSVYIQGVSYWAAMKSFGNPLVAGQEGSTRAIRRKDWPMAWECSEVINTTERPEGGVTLHFGWHPTLEAIHNAWLEVFEAEVDAWKDHLSDPANREALGIADKEPFRPALDHARWAIPGTISTGFAHTGNLRTMARVIHDGQMLAEQSGKAGAIAVDDMWTRIGDTYAAALPGLSEMGLREAVYESPADLDFHLIVTDLYQSVAPEDVVVDLHLTGDVIPPGVRGRKPGEKTYLDPWFNHFARVDIAYQCSLAVARDWHRHRTMMPWLMDIVWSDEGLLQLHHMYEPKSEIGKTKLAELLKMSSSAYRSFKAAGDDYRAMLCLPFGTKVRMSGQAGLRDAVYMLELRAFSHGANFEYKDQALRAMDLLIEQLNDAKVLCGSPLSHDVVEFMGLGGSQEAPVG